MYIYYVYCRNVMIHIYILVQYACACVIKPLENRSKIIFQESGFISYRMLNYPSS